VEIFSDTFPKSSAIRFALNHFRYFCSRRREKMDSLATGRSPSPHVGGFGMLAFYRGEFALSRPQIGTPFVAVQNALPHGFLIRKIAPGERKELPLKLTCAAAGNWDEAKVRIEGNFGRQEKPVLSFRLTPVAVN
jgi:hypothetical protein